MFQKLTFTLFVILSIALGCSKSPAGIPSGNSGGGSGDGGGNNSNEPQFQPIKETIPQGNQSPGFFLDNWQPKKISAPDYNKKSKPDGQLDSRILIDVNNIITKVPNTIYGNNTNPYNTQMVNQPKLVKYVKALNPHILRGPGGSLSDVYFWNRKPENPPADVPDSLWDSNAKAYKKADYWYGKNQASWSMSLDNYYKFLAKTNSKGILTVNFGYARYGTSNNPIAKAAHYAANWVRYDNGRTKYWEIGNEDYGNWEAGYRINTTWNKDGQPTVISGKLYGKIAKIYMDSMRSAAEEVGENIKIGAVLVDHKSKPGDTKVVRNWNSLYFQSAGNAADFYVVHNYYTPYQKDSSPSVILHSASKSTKKVMHWMNTTTQNNGVKLKPIALTEWNIFAQGSQQKVSDIAGMHAAMTLGNLIKYRYGMACRWDLANAWDGGNDHGMFNTPRAPAPDAPAWNPRPAFYHMYYFQKYFGGRMVWSGTQGNKSIKSFASIFSSGQVGLIVANTSDSTKVFDVQFKHSKPGPRYYWYTLSGGYKNSHYSRNVEINGQGASNHPGGPDNYADIKAYSALTSGTEGIKLSAPPYSVSYILIDHSK
jgi:hypothetical protein